MKQFLRDYLDDILLLAGCGVILIGLAQYSVIVTWLVGGLMLIGFSVLVGKVRS